MSINDAANQMSTSLAFNLKEIYLKHLKLEGVFVSFRSFGLFFGMRYCVDYFVLHDCKIVMLNYGQIFAFVENCWHQTYRFFYLICHPCMFKLSRATWNYWLSLDDVSSHKWCPSETCIYVLLGICITLSRDRSLTSDHEIRFGSIWMPLFRHGSGRIYRRFKFLVSLCVNIPKTFVAIKIQQSWN